MKGLQISPSLWHLTLHKRKSLLHCGSVTPDHNSNRCSRGSADSSQEGLSGGVGSRPMNPLLHTIEIVSTEFQLPTQASQPLPTNSGSNWKYSGGLASHKNCAQSAWPTTKTWATTYIKGDHFDGGWHMRCNVHRHSPDHQMVVHVGQKDRQRVQPLEQRLNHHPVPQPVSHIPGNTTQIKADALDIVLYSTPKVRLRSSRLPRCHMAQKAHRKFNAVEKTFDLHKTIELPLSQSIVTPTRNQQGCEGSICHALGNLQHDVVGEWLWEWRYGSFTCG